MPTRTIAHLRSTSAVVLAAGISFGFIPEALAGGEWPDSPNKAWFEKLQRPDNDKHPERDPSVQSCCGAADTVQTRFRVQPAGAYPEDRWYAWLNDQWVAIPSEVIVPEYAPDGRAYLFVIDVPADFDHERDQKLIACFVRPRGGL